MSRGKECLGWIVAIVSTTTSTAMAEGPQPDLARLRSHVETLASREFAGRREQGAVKTRAYLIDEFRRLKLEPLFEGSYTQDVMGKGPGEVLGVNVGARLAGTDPELRDRWVILGAHYDHLGTRGEVYYPGADDNASGVSMMLEVARSVVEGAEKPRRSLILVGFDLEERGTQGEFGLRGSQFFARNPPVPLDRVTLFVTADMIGRALGGVCESTAFVLGSEHEPEVRPWIRQAARGKPVDLALLGSDMLVIDRSDYGPFRTRKIPYLFFTTGENPAYHTPFDLAETLDYPKLEAISRIIHKVVLEATRSDLEVAWRDPPDYPVAEALAIREVLKTLLEHREALKVGAYQAGLMTQTISLVDAIAHRGSMTADERTRIARAAQIILFTVF